MSLNFVNYLFPIVFAGLFGLIGIVLLISARNEQQKAKATEQWPTVAGSVLSAHIDQQRRVSRNQGHTHTHISYKPVVEYTYEVNGQAYQGNRVAPGSGMSYDYATAQGMLSRYQPGQQATVHYDPVDPSQAVLETKAKGGVAMMIIGGLFLLIGVAGACITGGVAVALGF